MTESWCLPKENLSALIAIRLMRSLELLSALIFSPLPFTSLDAFLNSWCILNVPAAPAGRWHCHMASSSLCEPRVVFFGMLFPAVVVESQHLFLRWAGLVQPQTKLLLSFPVLWCHFEISAVPRAAPDTLVCQWCPSTVSQQPLALYWVSWGLKCYKGGGFCCAGSAPSFRCARSLSV